MKVKVRKKANTTKEENNRIYEFKSMEHFNSFYDLFEMYYSEIGLSSVDEVPT